MAAVSSDWPNAAGTIEQTIVRYGLFLVLGQPSLPPTLEFSPIPRFEDVIEIRIYAVGLPFVSIFPRKRLE